MEAVANFNYSGNVPDVRESIVQDRTTTEDPFDFVARERGFFDDSYWNPSVSGGVRLQWNLFNGFQSSARMQQRQIELERAELQLEQLRQSVVLQVERALRNLEAARQRILSQSRNVERAETNYAFARTRLQEGVADQLALREASDQLDLSRLSYLQAVYDFLVARSNLETALGQPLTPTSESYLMTRR